MSAGLALAASGAAGDSARAWGSAAIELAVLRRDLRAAWRGAAAEATLSSSRTIAERMDAVIAELDYLADVLAVEGDKLERAIDSAAVADQNINQSGGTAGEPGGEDQQLRVASADAALVARLSASAALDSIRALEQGPVDASTVAASAGRGPLGAVPAALPEDPRSLGAVWHRLGPSERAAWAARHPELSDAAGLPAGSRDALNRAEVAAALGADGTGRDGSASRRLTALAGHLRDHPGARVLTLRPDGRGAVAEGDPGRAGRVVTLVPGTGSSLESLGVSAERVAAACAAAGSSRGANGRGPNEAAGTEPCVAVVWQDYEAPQDLLSAAFDETPAREGAPALRDFQAGLRAITGGELDVLGYSYGGIVAGEATAGGESLPADGLLFVGSPGVAPPADAPGGGAGCADGVSGLSLLDAEGRAHGGDAESVGAVAQRWDAVPWWAITGTYGPNPAGGGFGAASATVGGAPDHGGYFDRGTESLAEIGRALAGFGR
ncbi:alpha/beta hydrolase [Dietzia sp.]|uniref:alpha/beta hydrolase n=1 Tax=Dietzia sp. TaxID=1871616 RepID=UPI002FD9F15D